MEKLEIPIDFNGNDTIFFKVKIDKLFTWVPSIFLACMFRHLSNLSPFHAVLISHHFSLGPARTLKDYIY